MKEIQLEQGYTLFLEKDKVSVEDGDYNEILTVQGKDVQMVSMYDEVAIEVQTDENGEVDMLLVYLHNGWTMEAEPMIGLNSKEEVQNMI